MLGVGGLLMFWYSGRVVLLSLFGGRRPLCRSCDSGARKWSRAMLKLAGVSVRVEGVENLALDGAFIIVANHESWFDVWALAGYLPIDAHFTNPAAGDTHMRASTTLRRLSHLLVTAGVIGMVFSFFYLASASMQDIVAGASGFISGALFITSGLVSLTILNVDESRQRAADEEIPAGGA